MNLIKKYMLAVILIISANTAIAAGFPDNDKAIYARMETKYGDVILKLFPDVAPVTVKAFVDRVNEGFYDGLYFHRVIPGFVAQGGDPTLSGKKAVNYTLPAEFTKRVKHKRGTLAMARLGNDINSATTQFYIAYTNLPHLDNNYTIFGEVESGMSAIDKIKKGDKMLKIYMIK